jgi:hypothetical protein
MVSSPTSSLKLAKQATGDNLNTHGVVLNEQVIDLIDEAVAHQVTKALSGDYVLSSTNYVTNEARQAYLIFTDGGLSSTPTVTAPSIEKWWWIKNAGSTYAITFGVSGGTSVSIRPGSTAAVFSDGTDCEIYDQEAGDLKPPTVAFDMNSQKITSLADPTADQDAATKAYVDTEVAAVVSDAAAASAASAAAAAASASDAADDAVATAADAASTAQDAIDAAASAAAAADSETNAAASAAEAASKISGPASATDNALVQFDGDTGKLAKNGPSIGTSANNLVQLDGSSRLPAVDGSQLTNLDTGGLTQISQTVVSAPVASVEFTSIPSTYDNLYIDFNAFSAAGTGNIRVAISGDNGSTYSSNLSIGSSEAAASEFFGGIIITNYAAEGGVVLAAIAKETVDPFATVITSNFLWSWRVTGGIDAIRIQPSASNADAGTLTLYGF